MAILTSQRALVAPHGGLPAITRLVWIATGPDHVMLRLRPMLAAAVRRRHKVMVLAPGLTPQNRLTLQAEGMESAALELPRRGLNPLARRSARRQLTQLLREWRAAAVVIDDHDLADDAVRACIQAQVAAIYACLPPLEFSHTAEPVPKAWHAALQASTAVFVATANDARVVAGALGVVPPLVHVLPFVTADLATFLPEPLPPLDEGLVFLGLSANRTDGGCVKQARPLFVAAAHTLAGRTRRARFLLGEHGGLAPSVPQPSAERLERMPMDVSDAAALQAAVRRAHVVVIDGMDAPHMVLLAAAFAMGRPVVAIDTALTRDVIAVGADGWCVPPEDATALGEAMAAFLKRPDLLVGMARSANQKAARRFGQDQAARLLCHGLSLADLRAAAA